MEIEEMLCYRVVVSSICLFQKRLKDTRTQRRNDEAFARMNIATSRENVQEACDRIIGALNAK